MKRVRKLLVPSILTCALLAALALAATASAEVRVGEATAPVNPRLNPEADVIAAKAEYDSTTGSQTFVVTTAAAPSPGTEAEPSELQMAAGLVTTNTCSLLAFNTPAFPMFAFEYQYAEEVPPAWRILESAKDEPEAPETLGLAVKSTVGSTTTLSATAPKAANQPFNCAAAYVYDPSSGIGPEMLFFPLAAPQPPSPPAAPTPAPSQSQAPAATATQPAPALSIAKAKPLRLKAGKWKTVRIKVVDTGDAATAPGSLRLKAPRGVLVKPERQRLPVLSAGGSWTVSAKVQLTATAKKRSKVTLTATAGSLTAKGSLVLKRKG
jgi:hypothetical protein